MAIPLLLIAAGSAMSAAGAVKSSLDKADAERRNADFFGEQAEQAQAIGDRELEIFRREQDRLRGRQFGAFAKAGVELTGSPLLFMETQYLQRLREDRAIRLETERRVRLARLKQMEAGNYADQLSDPLNLTLAAGPSILGGAGSVYKQVQDNKAAAMLAALTAKKGGSGA